MTLTVCRSISNISFEYTDFGAEANGDEIFGWRQLSDIRIDFY